jgi:hypothetical protein
MHPLGLCGRVFWVLFSATRLGEEPNNSIDVDLALMVLGKKRTIARGKI